MEKVVKAASGALVASLCALLCGCVGDPPPTGKLPDPPTASPSSVPSGASTSTQTEGFSVEQKAVISQYKGFYLGLYALAQPTDDEVRATLFPYATADYIESIVLTFRGYAQKGQQPAGAVEFGTMTVLIDGPNAEVDECRDSSTELIVDTATGAELGHGAPGTKIKAQLQYDASRGWIMAGKVSTAQAC